MYICIILLYINVFIYIFSSFMTTLCFCRKTFFLMFISLIHLELNFIYGMKIGSTFFFFPKWIISCSNTLYRTIHVGSMNAHLKGGRWRILSYLTKRWKLNVDETLEEENRYREGWCIALNLRTCVPLKGERKERN